MWREVMKVQFFLVLAAFYLGFFCRHLLAARKRIIRKLTMRMFKFGHY